MSGPEAVTLRQRENFQFDVEFGTTLPIWRVDEPPPLGAGAGPSPNQLLAAAVGNCLSASLLFALRKYKQDPGGITTTAVCQTGRNEKGRLRVQSIDVRIVLGRPATGIEHIDRVLGQFEDFCTVSQSVRAGITINVEVFDATGRKLK